MSTHLSNSPSPESSKPTCLEWHDEPSGRQDGQAGRPAELNWGPPSSGSGDRDGAARAILLGQSLAVCRLRSQAQRIAPYFRKALVRGEGGSGKRLVAQALHEMSPAAGPFVVCGAASLAEALAHSSSAPEVSSLLDSARGGTLFVQEISNVPYGLQAGLQRFLREQGGGLSVAYEQPRTAPPPAGLRGVRIIASSVRDLRMMSSVGQFRPDLYAQLSAVELCAPALRQRTDDLPMLAEWVLGRVSRRTGLPQKVLSDEAVSELGTRPWANNLRELETVVTHAAALAEGSVIQLRHLAPSAKIAVKATPEQTAKNRAERLQDVIHEHVVQVLTRCGGNKLRAAEVLGISRSTLYRMLDAGPGGSVA